MEEMRLLEPITSYCNYIYKNGKLYISGREAAKILEMNFNHFEVALNYARNGKPLRHREWFIDMLNTRIEDNGAFWYDRSVLDGYKQFLWDTEDFVFRMLNALDDIIENKIIPMEKLTEILGMTAGRIRQYTKCQKSLGFETALKIYTKLKQYHKGLK